MRRKSSTKQDWIIRQVTEENIEQVVGFINDTRHQMFAGLVWKGAPLADSTHRLVRTGWFVAAYERPALLQEGGSQDLRLVGTVGIVPYNHRFPQLKLSNLRTVEVVRLFVVPDCRRCGLGTLMVDSLCKEARSSDIDCLYLHTHPFLQGASEFWSKMGFRTVDVDREDAVWQTTHMIKIPKMSKSWSWLWTKARGSFREFRRASV
ncbi:hypothetical protein DOTSEDRAFT_75229 [Dothistroma septosporum NZE10]|uniref:N-acetyltransferase domain-containing protein n=1 Tax=Dothistroma septosporum (strain NZE10 / CBS 128990) TaxID=675120 RepID=M2YKU1_DOTSN|nr:hypothetical protein DOTSEDRAFT_75229 [Dothistroma septosporum NZE10]